MMELKNRDLIREAFADFRCPIRVAVETAIEAGDFVSKAKAVPMTTKDDPNVGHHAIVTDTDVKSQELIISAMRNRVENLFFIVEEDEASGDPTIITEKTLLLVQSSLVCEADPIDGSSEQARGSFEWSVSIGLADKGTLLGGGIYAPEVLGGFFIGGELDKGAYYWNGNKPGSIFSAHVTEEPLSGGAILIGQDLIFLDPFERFVHALGKKAQMTNTAGSCALGLAQVAVGQKTAIIQPHQGPWDYSAGIPLVIEAGGVVVFFHYRSGILEFIEYPDLPSFNPRIRNLGFIAGSPEAVPEMQTLLEETFVVRK